MRAADFAFRRTHRVYASLLDVRCESRHYPIPLTAYTLYVAAYLASCLVPAAGVVQLQTRSLVPRDFKLLVLPVNNN